MTREKTRKNYDTDKDETRNIRGERQFVFEKELPKLFDTSIVERFFAVRDALFSDMNNISGKRLDVLISNMAPGTYPDRELVAVKYLPTFFRFVDEIQEEIRDESDLIIQSERGFRLGVLLFIINILIHQSTDGNAQTNKLLALSYIHEFNPKLRNNFIPIKYDQGYKNDSHYDSSKDLASYIFEIESTLPPNLSQGDKNIFAIITKLRKIEYDSHRNKADQELIEHDWEEYERVMTERYMEIINEAKNTLDISFSEKISAYAEKNDYGLASYNARSEITSLLNKKYPGYHFSIYGDFRPDKNTTKEREFILSALLTQESGLDLLRLYVNQGSEAVKKDFPESDNSFLNFYHHATETFSTAENDFNSVLNAETSEVHNQKFEEFKKQQA